MAPPARVEPDAIRLLATEIQTVRGRTRDVLDEFDRRMTDVAATIAAAVEELASRAREAQAEAVVARAELEDCLSRPRVEGVVLDCSTPAAACAVAEAEAALARERSEEARRIQAEFEDVRARLQLRAVDARVSLDDQGEAAEAYLDRAAERLERYAAGLALGGSGRP